MEYILAALVFIILNIFGEGLLSLIGYILFNCLTLGLVRIDSGNESGVSFPWHGFARNSSGQLVIKASKAELYSLLLLFLAAVVVIALYKNVY